MGARDHDAEFHAFCSGARPACVCATTVTVRDLHAATEFVDDSFARAFERWDGVRDHPSPSGWVVNAEAKLERHHRVVLGASAADALGSATSSVSAALHRALAAPNETP